VLTLCVYGKGCNDSSIYDESNEKRNGALQIEIEISFLDLIFTFVIDFPAQDQS